MARTSKTVIGEDKGKADRLLRAAESGQQARSQAHSELMAQQRHGQEMALRGGIAIGEFTTAERNRNLQKKVETGRQALDQQQIDLASAEKGYKRQGGPTSPLLDERQKKLQAEMDKGQQQGGGMGPQGSPQGGGAPDVGPPTAEQQRRSDVMGKKVEYDGTFVPTAEGQAIQRRKNFEADTDRIKAEAYAEQNRNSLRQAQVTGDKEAEKNVKANMMKPLNDDAKLLSNFATGKFVDKDWDSLNAMVQDVPDAELQKEVQSKIPGPRIRSFLSSKIAFGALNFIKRTGGDMPDSNLIDLTSPQMQQFAHEVKESAALIASQGADFEQFLGFQDMAEKVRYQNEMAAKIVLSGMTTPQVSGEGGGGQGPMGGMTPSSGGVATRPQKPVNHDLGLPDISNLKVRP